MVYQVGSNTGKSTEDESVGNGIKRFRKVKKLGSNVLFGLKGVGQSGVVMSEWKERELEGACHDHAKD